jgi:hypothetical protein
VEYEIDSDKVLFKTKAVSSDPAKPIKIWLPVDRYEQVDSATVNGKPSLVTREGEHHVIVAPGLNTITEVKAEMKRSFVNSPDSRSERRRYRESPD